MSNIVKNKCFVIVLGIVLGMMGFIGVKTFSNVEGKNFNLWNATINLEYFNQDSKDFKEKSAAINEIHYACVANKKYIELLNGYEVRKAKVMASEPKIEVLTVIRVASSWKETPAHLKTNVSSGNISVDGTGKKTENYSVVAFNDGTYVKVTTDQMSAVRVGEKVIRKTSLEIHRNKGVYFVEERVTYQPLYK